MFSFTWASANRADETSDAREQHDSLAIFFLYNIIDMTPRM
ncbi:MAG: hypothetical protein PHO27_04505 [Sulfuricurvum sp.]|nr:hypothetical protein [Sulfuricurvum sp.]